MIVLSANHRDCRMAILLMTIAILSFADCYMTYQHLSNFGLLELNPIARIMCRSLISLFLWKTVTVGFAVAIMIYYRRFLIIELTAIFLACLLVCLMIRWECYNAQMQSPTTDFSGFTDDPSFVVVVRKLR